MATIYTIGHSTRTLGELIEALQAHSIHTLVDIRAYPASRRLPHFQGPQYPPFMTQEEAGQHEALETTLPRAGIAYVWKRELGGRRKKLRHDSPHIALRSAAFRNYADYMLTAEFQRAVQDVVRLAEQGRTAIMCSERLYFRCHRMLVSDWLLAHRHEVLHIDAAGPVRSHRLTPEARLVGGELIYRGDRLL